MSARTAGYDGEGHGFEEVKEVKEVNNSGMFLTEMRTNHRRMRLG
jgi:hypothetical protein